MEFLEQIVAVDTFTLLVVAMLSGWAGVLTLHVLSKTALALVFVPGFTFGALLTNHVFLLTGYLPTHDRHTNTIIACTAGIIIAFLLLLGAMRLTKYLVGVQLKRYRFRRDMQSGTPFRRELRGA
jgi:hypothetical protein